MQWPSRGLLRKSPSGGGQYAQQVVRSGGCARLEQQPHGLQVIKARDALQQAVMLSALALEVMG